jgi:hypothetical protein
MRGLRLRATAAAVAVVLAASGCGGGGGGGGGSSFVATPEQVKPLVLTVRINGVSPSGTDSHVIRAGDVVEVAASAESTWTSSGDNVQLRGASSSTTQWRAGLVKSAAAASTLTLKASAGADAVLNKTLTFTLPAGDPRNGSYRVYATNGSRAKLSLDFDSSTYTLGSSTSGDSDASGSFSPDATEAGTYVFANTRTAAVTNTARFRVTTDGVVGTFPLTPPPFGGSTAYTVQSFVAARAFVLDQAQLDGNFNRLGIEFVQGVGQSDIGAMQIASTGTKLKRCSDFTLYAIANCPAASLRTYTISADSNEPGRWTFVDDANAANTGAFVLAQIGGTSVYLAAGLAGDPSRPSQFRIGLPSLALPAAFTARGGSNTGQWGIVELVNGNDYTHTESTPDGLTLVHTSTLAPSPVLTGLYGMTYGGSNYFAIGSGKIFAVVGARDNLSKGQIHIDLVD